MSRPIYRCSACGKQACVRQYRARCEECKAANRPVLPTATSRDLRAARIAKTRENLVVNVRKEFIDDNTPYGEAMALVGERLGSNPRTWAVMDPRWNEVCDMARIIANIPHQSRRVA